MIFSLTDLPFTPKVLTFFAPDLSYSSSDQRIVANSKVLGVYTFENNNPQEKETGIGGFVAAYQDTTLKCGNLAWKNETAQNAIKRTDNSVTIDFTNAPSYLGATYFKAGHPYIWLVQG